MAFKIERFIPSSPIKFDPKDPYASSGGNKSKYSPDKDTKIVSDYSSYNPKEHSRVRNYFAENKYKSAQGRLSTVKKTAPVDSEPKIKVKSQVTKDGESGYEADDRARKNKTGIYAPKQKKTVKRRKKASTIEAPKAKKIERTIEAPKASDVNVSKKPTVKTAPKDNSRKAIRKRKKADKAAGVSKSQMRANKAKSKSEAASAKAKKSKNPSYRAQLTAKSERLAKRAKRKGNS